MKVRVIEVVEVTTTESSETVINLTNEIALVKREVKSYYDTDGNLLFKRDETAKSLNELISSSIREVRK